MPGGAEIPVWVGGLQKWVTGLTKKTTCEDIVRALLRSEGRPQVELDKESGHYVLVERWRKVERPLDSKTKVLKVWKAWAEEQPNVRITLKRSQPSLTPKEVKALRIKRSTMGTSGGSPKSRSGTAKACNVYTVHPRKLMQQQESSHYKQCSDMDGRITDTMERLMKVIIAQGQTIQAQLQRIQDKDNQIDFFEQQVHVMRVEEMGANYLVDSYLKDSELSKGITPTEKTAQDETTCAAAAPTVEEPGAGSALSNEQKQEYDEEEEEEKEDDNKDNEENADNKVRDLKRCARHYERLLVLSDRLEREENMVIWLTSQMEQLRQKLPTSTSSEHTNKEEVLAELELLRERVECLAAQNVANDVEVDENESAILDVCRSIADKHCYVAHLERDLSEVELDSSRLMRSDRELTTTATTLSSSSSSPLSRDCSSVVGCKLLDKDRQNDTDSNSDTGLSSLHSSCDEGGPGAYVLDTLV